MCTAPVKPFVPGPVVTLNPLEIMRDAYTRWGPMLAAQVVGFDVAEHVARRAGLFLWNKVPLFRQGVRDTIAGALGHVHTAAQVDAIAREFASTFWHLFLEAEFAHRKLTVPTWRNHVRLADADRIQERLDTGQGVVAAGTYFGSHQIGMTALALRTQGRLAAIVSPRQFSTQRRWMAGLVRRGLAALCPAGDAIRGSLGALREGRVVMMIIEHTRAGRGAVTAEFLGRRQAFHPTAAMLAWRMRCPIAVVACRRLNVPYQFEGRIHDWIEPGGSARKRWIEETTVRIVRALDGLVREHPEQYAWLRQHLLAGQGEQATA